MSAPCKWCGAEEADGTPCPWSLECPTCHVAPGKRCKRPSEHSGPFVAMHAARYKLAESMPAARERAVSAPLAPLPAQLDLDGGAHELAPQTRQDRLFAPAPAQLEGQTFITDQQLESE